jgi:hypothetical protein
MPLQKLAFRPGTNRESTNYNNEGGWYQTNKVRFRSGQPEKIGGWVKDAGALSPVVGTVSTSIAYPTTGTLWGVCRAMWNWITLSGYNLLALGTNLKYYIQNGNGGNFYDVTPITGIPPAAVTVASNAFTTTASASGANRYVTVTCNVSGYNGQTNDFVTISGVASAVNGIPAANLNAEFQMTYVNSSQFTIQVYVASTVTVTAGTTGAAVFAFQITTGGDVFTIGTGWGAGGWGGSTGPLFTTALNGALATVSNTVLSAAIDNAVTTISVASTATLAASGSVLIDSEIISYSGVTATTLTGCTRGASGSTAAAHVSATGVIQYSTVTINVTDASTFAATGTFAVGGEVISYSGKTGTSFTGCVRGYAGYVTAHASGASVVQYASSGTSAATGWGSAAPAGLGIGVQLRTWSQSNYGQNLVFNPRGGAIYYWVVDTNPTIFNRAQAINAGNNNTQNSNAYWDADASCPTLCNFVLVSDASRLLIAFGTNDPTGVEATTALDPMQIRWSDKEDLLTWTPALTNLAGGYRLSHGSSIITAQQTRQEILVFTDSAVYSMQFIGPPYVWNFQLLGDNISIAGPNAVATANNITYWMGLDKFYMYSGRVETLPSTLREYVFTDINRSQSFQFVAGTNEGYSEIWWQYCSANSNVIDRYVIYNYLDQVWYYGDWTNYAGAYQGRTAWLDSSLRALPMATTYGAAGGSTNALLVYHESGVDDGTVNPAVPIVANVQSSDFDIGEGNNFGFVWRLIPDLTFDGSNVNQPTAYFTALPRTFPGAAYGPSNNPGVTSTQNYQNQITYNVQQFTQQVYVRIRGRQMAFRVSSGTTGNALDGLGVQWQLGAPRIDIRPDGRR